MLNPMIQFSICNTVCMSLLVAVSAWGPPEDSEMKKQSTTLKNSLLGWEICCFLLLKGPFNSLTCVQAHHFWLIELQSSCVY